LITILGPIFTLLLKLNNIETNQPVSQSQRDIDSLARLLLKVTVGIRNSILLKAQNSFWINFQCLPFDFLISFLGTSL
jgi:hypothetical protein